jgi:Na+/H+ antiporter
MHPVEIFELIVGLLVAVVALHYLALRLKLPPAVALIVGGGALAFLPGLPTIEVDPELVLVVFLPPLLMDGAWFTAHGSFRRHLVGILSLAIGAVLFTTAIVAVAAKLLLPSLPWGACVVLGAVVAPPDAVSARAILQHVKLPRRLNTVLEGESLLNDATGLVLVRIGVAAVLTGTFSVPAAMGSFVLLVLGGIAVGGAIGALWVVIVRRLGDERLMIAASTMCCWIAYLAGEKIHVSGVIATVATGLICGWYQHDVFAASTRIRGVASWHVIVFLLEAAVFILIGFSLRGVLHRVGGPTVVIEKMGPFVLTTIAAVTIARFVWIFGSDRILALLKRDPLGVRGATVMSWAGMRGVVTLAVALTLPEAMPGRDLILVSAFAVIVVTVLVQGTTLGVVIRRAKLEEDPRSRPPLDLTAAEVALMKAQYVEVQRLAYDANGTLIHPRLLERYRLRATSSDNFTGTPEDRVRLIAAHYDIVIAGVAAGRAALVGLHRQNQIDDETLHDLERDLDLEELSATLAKG